MKILWIDDEREVPGVGICERNKEYTVGDGVGRALIKQKQAKEAKEKTIKDVIKED